MLLTESLIKFLNIHVETKEELEDIEYISQCIHTYYENTFGIIIAEKDAIDLASQYAILKVN